MTNIIALITPKGVFSYTRRIVPNPLKGASNENQIKAEARHNLIREKPAHLVAR
jgi:hypothetical protein